MQEQEFIVAGYSNNEIDELDLAEPPPSPNDPPWNSWTAIGYWLLSLLLMLVVPSLIVLPYLIRAKLAEGSDVKKFLTTDPIAVLLSVGAVIPIHAILLVVGWFIVTKARRFPFWATLGMKWGGIKIWHLIAILVGFFALAWVVTYFFPPRDDDMLRILRTSRYAAFLVAFLATFTATMTEELVYRGVLYSALQRSVGVKLAVLIVTTAFAGIHFFQYWGNTPSLIVITVVSLALTLIRAKTGNLLPCIVLHFVFNGLQSVGILFGSYLPETTPDPQAVTGFIRHVFC